MLTDGQAVQVKVLSIAPDGKIALSIKRTQPAPERGARPQNAGARPAGNHRPKREEKPRVWQPKPAAPQGEMSFEDMMARYKSRSEEKIADLKRVTETTAAATPAGAADRAQVYMAGLSRPAPFVRHSTLTGFCRRG